MPDQNRASLPVGDLAERKRDRKAQFWQGHAAILAAAILAAVSLYEFVVNRKSAIEKTAMSRQKDQMAYVDQGEKEKLVALEKRLRESEEQRNADVEGLKQQLVDVQTNLVSVQKKSQDSQNQVDALKQQLSDTQTRLSDVQHKLADAQAKLELKENGKSGREGVTSIDSGKHPKNDRPSYKDIGLFRFEVGDCVRTGTLVRCSGTVTNLGSEPANLYLRWGECYVVDNFRNQIPLSDQIFKLGDDTRKPLQPKLPIAFHVLLDDPKEDSTHATLILSVAGRQFPLPMEQNRPLQLEFSIPERH